MLTRWMERIFDDQLAPARFVVLSVLALGDLRLLHRPEDPWDWALALGALAVCLAGCRAPLAAAVTLSALLVSGDLLGAHVGVPLKAMIAVSLFELALRTSGRRLAAGIGVTTVLLTLHALNAASAQVLPTLYRLSILAGLPLLFGAYVRLMRENARQARERVCEEERRRRSETLAARAAERTAIARELHDLVAHHVSSMVLRVGVARHVLTDVDPRMTEVLDDLHGSGAAALADLRRLVALLRDPAQVHDDPAVSLVEPAGLVEALEAALERGRQTGLTVSADVDPAIGGLDAVRGLTILRLTQEGMANVARHAGPAASARFSVRLDGDTVRLEIVDDGGRPDPAAAGVGATVRSGGHGLIGMTERAQLLGGRLAAGPVPGGRGWRLLAELPSGTAPSDGPVAAPGTDAVAGPAPQAPALATFSAPPPERPLGTLDRGGPLGGPGR
ncbi:sensor histidine kinase [Thermomonospora echinospora]|uniref:sensor histidine kinase n=1 Tax=Thermomonospora echinospora TaxID=1992 RepID=UPI00190EBBFC|nr:histidine kinase [Thermomonospora echinospora]